MAELPTPAYRSGCVGINTALNLLASSARVLMNGRRIAAAEAETARLQTAQNHGDLPFINDR
ncbi:MAG: hypothetical protein ACLTVY_06275 [Faecalibacterium sp.]